MSISIMKIVAAPGPVSYPLILATREYRDLDLVFGKGSDEPAHTQLLIH
ncbi:DUF3834 domain-containing protein [Vulcanisaeta sp. JCM 16159]